MVQSWGEVAADTSIIFRRSATCLFLPRATQLLGNTSKTLFVQQRIVDHEL